MGFLNKVTGADVLERVTAAQDDMERVYVAFATRITEALDRQARVEQELALFTARQRQQRAGIAVALALGGVALLMSIAGVLL